MNGALTCQGGVLPQSEVCDGVDNDCDGSIDETPFADAPEVGQNGCWTNAGACCQFPATSPDLTWCPPAGATCTGTGALAPPCTPGNLVCAGGAWTCAHALWPRTEACDGIDNDCNGAVDDGAPCPAGRTCTGGACR